LILNLYFWIFPAAVFTAAAMSNLSFLLKMKIKHESSGSNRIVWFFLNLSVAFIVFIVSVFFVNWENLVWSWSYVCFFLIFLVVFYFGFIFKLKIGFPLFFFLSAIVLFFTIYFHDWNIVPPGGEIAHYRLLSKADNEIKAELYGIKNEPLFMENPGDSIYLELVTVKTNSVLFFIKPDLYYKWSEFPFDSGFFDNVINYFSEKTFFLSKSTHSINIGKERILYLYNIVLSPENKIIIMEN